MGSDPIELAQGDVINPNIGMANEVKDCTFNNNLVGSLKVDPRNVKLEAVVNHELLVVIISATLGGIMTFSFGYFTPFSLYPWSIFLIYIIAVSILYPRYITKLKRYRAIYSDNVLELNGVQHRFYSEIWDVSYKATLLDSGILTIWGIDPENEKPYKKNVKFGHSAWAKYVYDSFWSGKKIKEYEDGQ